MKSTFLLAVLILLTTASAPTRASSAEQMETGTATLAGQTEGDFVINDFQFKDGAVLPELRLHYLTLGSVHRNASGLIDNAVLLLHSTASDTTEFLDPEFSEPLFGTGKPFDLSKFYVIIPDAIGHGKSSKPSDGLRAHFPHYEYEDMVSAQYRLVTEKLGVTQLRLIMGLSMGGMHAWLWGERHPDMMDALMPISALPVQIAGRNRLWRRMVIEAIRNDPDWKNGDYEQQPHGYARIAPLVAMMVSSPVRLYETYPTRAAADDFYTHIVEVAGKRADANDRLYQYDCSRNYDPAPDLEKIKAKLLLIVFADDQINSPELGALDREMPRVANGRFVVVRAGRDSNGEGNNTKAKLWRAYLEQLLASTPNSGTTMNQTEASSVERELARAMDERHKAVIAGDTATVERLTADEYVQTDIYGYVQDRSTWLNEYFHPLATLIKAGKFRWDTYEEKEVQIHMFGDTAVVTGSMALKGTGAKSSGHTWVESSETSFAGTLRFTRVWVNRDGGWRLAALQNALMQPSNDDRNKAGRDAQSHGNSEAAKLVTLTNEWTDAINSRNRQKLDVLMASDFALYHWNGQLGAARAQWLDHLFNHIKITKNTLTDAAPQVYGDFGVVTSVGDWVGTFDSKAFSQKCIVVDTWRKIDNQWKVVRRTSHCYTEDSASGRVNWNF